MEMQELIKQAEENIRQALSDYGKHSNMTGVLDDVTEDFIRTLASDSVRAKQDLRELFSKSPVWDEKLDALVINGTRTHNPDYNRIYDLANQILYVPRRSADGDRFYDIKAAIQFFSNPNQSEEEHQYSIDAINRLAPKAYTPTKKPSRVFKAICAALGVVDETAGSEFQRLYAQFADELTSKKISFKMYVSINPAHFLTMSNPKGDRRGNTLTSCHSFNSTEYEYNCGCSGYARDTTSFIVFTVADPADPETFNNRKTTRQIFAYRPGSGLLLQSRMYNTSGGVYGAAEDSQLYRDLVQREISMLENVPNLWKTSSSYGEKAGLVAKGDGFGGYADWTYDNFDGHISIRTDCDADTVEPLEVGTYGLCIECGCEIESGLYCDDCKHGKYTCEDCENYCDDTTRVYRDGEEIYVCRDCLNDYYVWCEGCEEYHYEDDVTYIDDESYCDDCRDEYCEECYECDEWHRRDHMTMVYDHRGNEVWVCEDCLDNYFYCERCHTYHSNDEMNEVRLASGEEIYVCNDCREDFAFCPECESPIEICSDGSCPKCGVILEMEDKAV